ncbi:IPT/TIG domain-containing protein [Actinoplanes derwentensis]|uniref:IPT/TIG domain-containing protein n=1 Tax=Actinoplanes derwentensis TaxID=113562 RepID=A0A1H1YSR6_9ACTN|nr:IPT/TIG domain-containing protein [Actinoplanes derwentensis]GID81273.1 hypothetical protein Ade03nite_01970 [Actinoplanes derwentensis]SDT24484.1 IPT/TIG domain-containing protein [Actinoplanes derwentensis]
MQGTSSIVRVSAALVLGAASVPFLASPAWAAAPAITSFSPANAAVDDTITVTGTGLNQASAVVKVNGITATVTGTPTATSLTFKVPPDTSGGKIALTNVGGTGTSSTDLFIAPPFTTVADISGTARTTVATKLSLSIPAGKKVLRVFDTTVGDRVAVVTENATPGGCTFEAAVYDVGMVNLGTGDCRRVNAGWVETLTPTSITGTQTLQVSNLSASAGSVDVTVVKIPADANLGVLPLDGTTKVATITNPGQNGYLTFTTVAPNQKVSVKTTDASAIFACCGLRWGIYNSAGTKLGSSIGNAYLDGLLLATADTYQLRIDPLDARTGSVTVAASLTPADANLGALTTDGVTKTVSISSPGQNGYLTFSGTAGQKVALRVSDVATSLGVRDLKWGLYGPTGTRLSNSAGNAYADNITLPVTGAYQVRFDPVGTKTGSFTAAAYLLQPDLDLGAITLDGVTKVATISNAGQNGYLSFTGTAGQRIAVQTTAASSVFGCCKLSWGLFTSGGTRLGGATGNGYLNAVTLPSNGTYQVRIDPTESLTGSITVAAWDVPADVNLGGLTTDGTTKTVTISNSGQNGYVTLVGTSGQKLTLKATRASAAFGCCYVAWTLKRPDGTAQKRWTGNATGKVTLSATGTYRIYVDPIAHRIGSITFAATVS